MNIFHQKNQELQLEEQLQKTLQAITAYKQTKWDSLCEHQPIDELLYECLGQNRYEDKIPIYEQSLVELLSFLVIPKVALLFREHFPEPVQHNIANMLFNLYDFMRQLNQEPYLLQLLLIDVQSKATDGLNTLQRLELEYTIKLETYLQERCLIEKEAKRLMIERLQ